MPHTFVGQNVGDAAHNVAEKTKDVVHNVGEKVVVRRDSTRSVAVAFGFGLVAGLIAGLALRSRESIS